MLSASFYYFWDDRLNCARAKRKMAERSKNTEYAEKAISTQYGCHTYQETARITIDGIHYHSCLCNYEHPLFYAYWELAEKLERGILPDKGAYMDQPAQLLEAIQLINRHKLEAQASEQAKHKDKAVKKHGR